MKIQFEININDKLIVFFRKIFNVKTTVFFIAVCLFFIGVYIFSGEFDTAYIFVRNDVISSAEVNQNFQNLAERTLGSISDVNISSAELNDVLKFNGVNWYAGNDNGGIEGDCEWDTVIGGINYENGNVGIGVTEPECQLDLSSSDLIGGDDQETGTHYIRDRISIAIGKSYSGMVIGCNEPAASMYGYGMISISNANNSNYNYWSLISDRYDEEGGNFHIQKCENINNPYFSVRYLTINNSGNVGIGTTNPNSKLAVTGLPEYLNNDDAYAHGLDVGDFYRTGDLLKVVH